MPVAAMTEREFEELDEILSQAPLEGAMACDEADGWLTASVLAPQPPRKALWLGEVLASCGFGSGQTALEERLVFLLSKRRAQLSDEIARGAVFDPVVFADEDDAPEALAGFAFGFYKGCLSFAGLLDTQDEDVAGAVLAVLRFLPEEAFAGDAPLEQARRELIAEHPVFTLEEGLDDLAEAVATMAEAAGLVKKTPAPARRKASR